MPHTQIITGDQRVDLAAHDPDGNSGLNKAEGLAEMEQVGAQLSQLQTELYAAGQHSLLIILQGPDTSGKDGVIRHVFRYANPQGCRVESFKVPTEEELAHDFLWRAHRVTPRLGMLGVFNRSYYEDVLVVRVHNLVPEKVWRARYEQINAFEQILAANHTIILKFFLHISKDEQHQRLLEREQDPATAWKLSVGDWREREHWDAYTEAYQEALSRCSSAQAPWHLVPANRKWLRNLAVAQTIVERLQRERASWASTLDTMSKARLTELQAYRESLQPAPADASQPIKGHRGTRHKS